jgi:hypothetical protein
MRTLSIIMLLLLTSYGNAQTLDSGTVRFPAKGQVTESIKVYSAPPSGPLNVFLGKEIVTLRPGQTVSIVGMRSYPGLSRASIWYQIQPTNLRDRNLSESWWVYGGEKGGKSPIRIIN